jgi:hypothetical protein
VIEPIFVGQIEVRSNCDLVDILHREPVMHETTHTFTGRFESKPHWTALTPEKARQLAAAIVAVADKLDAIGAAKALQHSSQKCDGGAAQ